MFNYCVNFFEFTFGLTFYVFFNIVDFHVDFFS